MFPGAEWKNLSYAPLKTFLAQRLFPDGNICCFMTLARADLWFGRDAEAFF